MRRLGKILTCAAALLALAAPPASAQFGLAEFDVAFTADEEGTPLREAGAHPYEMITTLGVRTAVEPGLGEVPDEPLRNFTLAQIEGLVGNPTAVPPCSTLEFLDHVGVNPSCGDSSAVGYVELQIINPDEQSLPAPVYNLATPPGVAARLGFWALNTPVTIDVGVNEAYPHNIVARGRNIPQTVPFYRAVTTLWGVPADSRHDGLRGGCISVPDSCNADIDPEPFLTVPRSCEGPLGTDYRVVSWLNPPSVEAGSVLTHDQLGNPRGFEFCEELLFKPEIEALPTTRSAESPTGFDVRLRVADEGLTSPEGRADSEIREAVVTLPEGMTANPSLAEGLGTCSLGEYEEERVDSAPDEGCPNDSKVGTVSVRTPLLEGELLTGEVYVAEPDEPATAASENPFDTLIALYMVFRSTELGIVVKQALKVEPDPGSGQLVATASDIPQLPFSDFRMRLREGGRSPLISPPECGEHEVEAEFTPWADPGSELERSFSFRITSGVGGGPCPSGPQPFEPGFAAGSAHNAAGAFSPFSMRLTRRDGDRALTRFDATLPPGVVGRLAGLDRCPEAQIALARDKRGRAELRSPSCPANSRIGRIVAGAGVGSQLVYVPGSLYLAGPYRGAPLSVVALTPAVAGPFDVGTVVVRQALVVDPLTAEVRADGASSDPIPSILAGIPLRVRDIQVFADRPGFTLNPTSCALKATRALIAGEGLPVPRSAPFQAAGCAALGFRPRLGLRLRGGTRRGANPALLAVLRPRPGDANISRAAVRLPRSAFLDQAHIRTICTRVQFAADACPKGAVYGRVTAFSPLLDEPLRGPAYLRSSNNQLPDLVFDLRGEIDIESSARIDSIRGGIRATFPAIPDAPLSKVVVRMQGGKKGLIVNSRHLCRGKARANVRLDAHSGKRQVLRPLVRPTACKGKGRRGRGR